MIARLPTAAALLLGAFSLPAVAGELAGAAALAAPSAELACGMDGPSALRDHSAGEEADHAALLAFYRARQCAPLWFADGRLSERGAAVVAEIAGSDAWGLNASAFRLPEVTPLSRPSSGEAEQAEALISLAVLKYARYARGGRAEPTALSRNLDRTLPVLDAARVIGEIAAAPDAAKYLRELNPHHPEFEALRQKYLLLARSPTPAPGADTDKVLARKLLVNMEEWRWMPDDLGEFHILINVPEFLLRVVRQGKVIHAQPVIVGKPDKETPIFSAQLDRVIFHPTWGVPDSIKTVDILPSLLRGSTRILERYNLHVQRGGHDIDPAAVDWATTDMRSVNIYQPPGGANVLGFVKFRFPNKHDVYLHDTPDKYLFKAAARAFSHGCMRLSDAKTLAEVVLGEDQAWSAQRVAAAISGAGQNDEIAVRHPIAVHVTYFTAAVEAGKLVTFPDIYGHETRIAMGIEGKAHLIPKTKSEPTQAEVVGRLMESSQGALKVDWIARAFGNN